MTTHWKIMGLAAVTGVMASGCVDRAAQQQAKRTAAIVTDTTRVVSVTTPKAQPLEETLEVTGQIATSLDSQVGAKQTGRLVEVYVKDADPVKAGQIIAKQDTTQLQAQLTQALASVQTAQASYQSAQSQLAQALQNAAINPQRSAAGVREAQAGLRSAQANLQKVQTGARPQERLQAQATVASAKANLETQQKELARIRVLVQEGALAGNRLDQQQATFEAARTQYENAVQSLRLIQEGNREEDVRAAQAQVQQAREQVASARATQNLDVTYQEQVNAARAQVSSAQAQIQNAQAQVRIARQALEDTNIRAPFDGRISGTPAQVGTVVSPGTAVARVIGKGGAYFEGDVPESSVALVTPGKSVQVNIEALNTTIPGRVSGVNPQGTEVGRQFAARIDLINPPPGVRPGLFASGVISLRTIPSALTIPASAVIQRDGRDVVFTVENGVARQVLVQLGIRGRGVVQVKNLPENAQVVTAGQAGIEDGSKVRVEAAKPVAANEVGNGKG